MSPARLGFVVVTLAVALCLTGAAQADADPASDTLYVRDVFLPLSARVSPQLAQKLLDSRVRRAAPASRSRSR
jgi:hypothetical protein